MGAQHKQKNAVDVESTHTATPSAGGKILFLKIFDSCLTPSVRPCVVGADTELTQWPIPH